MGADYQQYPFPKGKHPPGWAETTAGEVLLEIRSGYSSGKHNQTGQGIPHLRPMNVSPVGEISMEDVRYVAPSAGRLRLAKDDVLFTNTSSTVWVGKTAVVKKPGDWGFSNHMTRLRVADGMSPEFVGRQLHYLCISGYFAFHCKKHINQSSVAGTHLAESVPFRLPPAKEQQRIVAKLRRLLARERKLRQQLDELPMLIQQYRAAVLEAACTGRLVPTQAQLARKERRDFESASVLLERMPNERRSEWERQELARMEAGNRKPKDDSWKERYHEPEPLTATPARSLPNGWRWARIGQCGVVQLGRQRSPEHHTGKHLRPYLRVANVFEDRIDLRDVKQMNFTPEEFEVFRLRPNDILLNEGQSLDLIGRPAMYRGEVEGACFQNTLIRFRPLPSLVPEYALAVFRHYLHSRRFREIGKIVTNLAHLGAGRFADLEFPLPPLAEQKRIVTELAQRLDLIDKLNEQVSVALEQATRLRVSLFHQAVSGGLVPQSANDEPAGELLKRIAAAKEARAVEQKKSKTQRRMKKTKTRGVIPLREELLSVIKNQFGGKSFTFNQLVPHFSADYESIKVEIFNLLAAKQGRRLKQVFNPDAAQMELQQVGS
jgi:type I restriction enzyme S subunit